MKKFDLILFADYFQFHLQDENVVSGLEDSWTEEAVQNLFALSPGLIGVGTVRNMDVPVTVEIVDTAPQEDSNPWDQINECSIEIGSGILVVTGNEYFPDATCIYLTPGSYRARIFYANLDSLRENGLEGDDKYRVVLWPAPFRDAVVIKSRA